MRFLLGFGLFAFSVFLLLLLRPRDGQERRIVRLPAAWIVIGLLLTMSFASALALILTGLLA